MAVFEGLQDRRARFCVPRRSSKLALPGSELMIDPRMIPNCAQKVAVCGNDIFLPIPSHALAILVPVRPLMLVVVMLPIEFRAAHALLMGVAGPNLDCVRPANLAPLILARGESPILDAHHVGATHGR